MLAFIICFLLLSMSKFYAIHHNLNSDSLDESPLPPPPPQSTTSPPSSSSTAMIQRIAFGSCNNPLKGGQIWNLITSTDPDRLILLGDNVYADKKKSIMGHFEAASPIRIQYMYSLLKNDPNFKGLVKHLGGFSKGINAIYDDHDYGINDGDMSFESRDESMTLFWDFLDVEMTSPRRKQSGVYSSQSVRVALPNRNRNSNNSSNSNSDSGGNSMGYSGVFDYKVILVDTRSNNNVKLSFASECDFLGDEQWSWLEQQLLQQPFPDLILLGSGIQVLPTDKVIEEVWNACPRSRTRLLKLVKVASEFTNIVLLSGDIHSAEVLQANLNFESDKTESYSSSQSSSSDETSSPSPYHLYEFTSSGLSHTVNRIIDHDITIRSNNSFIDYSVSDKIKTKSRSPFVGYFYNLYQAIGPHSYRMDRFYDTYQGVHFGSMEIHHQAIDFDNSSSNSNSSTNHMEGDAPDSAFYLSMDIINHEGNVVMNKMVPLKSFKKTKSFSDKITKKIQSTTEAASEADSASSIAPQTESLIQSKIDSLMKLGVVETPWNGPIRRWRLVVFQITVSLLLLVFVVIPVLVRKQDICHTLTLTLISQALSLYN